MSSSTPDTTRLRAHDELQKRLDAYRAAKALYEGPDLHDREEARYDAMHVALGRIGYDEALAQALLDEVERLNAALGLAYPRALQAAAALVTAEGMPKSVLDDAPEVRRWVDDVSDAILELTEEQVDAFAAQMEAAAQVAEHYVCPGCHVVDDEPCLPGCIDAEIEGERRTPFDGFSEFMADDGDDEPEEGGTP